VIRQLLAGVQLDDGPARFDRITRENADGDAAAGSHSHFRVVLHEGRNREVRAERGGVRGQPPASGPVRPRRVAARPAPWVRP